jgi:hypothetical protein
MSRTPLAFTRVRIASPCSASWEEMKGDDRVRFCKHCDLQVFNLSGLSEREAEELITETEGRLCVRFYRRADGTVITADCPLGLQAFRRAVWRTIAYAGGAAALIFAYLAGVVSSATEKTESMNSGARGPNTVLTFVDWVQNKLLPRPIMGAVCPPSNPSTGAGNGMEGDCKPDELDPS